jgi:hypothetical protein
MIIKLALVSSSNDYKDLLNKSDREKYKAIKAGAVFGGTSLAGKYLSKTENVLKPDLGRVRRFLIEKQLMAPRLKDQVTKRIFTPGEAAKMGAIGVAGGALVGLALHEANKKIKQFKEYNK